MANPYAKYANPNRGVVIADPYRAAEEDRKAAEERRRQEDQALQQRQFEAQQAAEARRLAISQQNADTSAANASVTAANANKPPAGYRWGANGALEVIPGGPADKGKVDPVRAAASAAADLRAVIAKIDEIEKDAKDNGGLLETGASGAFARKWLPDGTAGYDLAANLETIDANSAFASLQAMRDASPTGGALGQITERELDLLKSKVANLNPNQSQETFLANLADARSFYADKLAQVETVAPPSDDRDSALDRNRIIGAGVGAAGGGATTQSEPIPPEMQAEYDDFLAGWISNPDPEVYAAKRAELDMRYGYQSNPDDYRAWAEDTAAKLNAGGATVSPTIPGVEGPLEGFDKLRNDVVSNPAGSFVASMGNAGSFGIPSLMAREQTQAMRDVNPVSSFAGELAGGVTGTLGMGGLLAKAGAKVANPRVAQILANPATADVAYGASYGATQADDPLYGAMGGAAASFAGNRAGQFIGKALPRVTGVKAADDPLNRGERAIMEALTDPDTVEASLQQAQELGVPASIADFSPEVNTLAGAALRRSPTASGNAREALFRRGQDQYDRFNTAIARDLGPVENIPQRSAELSQQAKAQAGPLYDEAYGAAGAEEVDLSDLMNSPTFRKALKEGYMEAADEPGADMASLGFEMDEAGDVFMARGPTWQTLDYAKRGLDNIIESNTSKLDGINAAGRRAAIMKQDLVSRMDKANPAYAQARAAYAGPAAEREALRRGQDAIRMDPNQLGVNMGNASPAQVDQMRLGFQSALSDKAGGYSASTNPFNSLLNKPSMESRLSTMYGDEANVARLLAQRDMEGQLASSTNKLVGNSQTAEKLAADEAFGQQTLAGDIMQGGVETLVTGAPVATAMKSGIGRGLGSAIRDYRTLGIGRRATEMADEIAPVAINTDPAASLAALENMVGRDEAYRIIMDELLATARTRGGHGGAGVAAVGNAAIQR